MCVALYGVSSRSYSGTNQIVISQPLPLPIFLGLCEILPLEAIVGSTRWKLLYKPTPTIIDIGLHASCMNRVRLVFQITLAMPAP